ncbi:MAG: endonuclease/exonuclease/phosphatase family protein [Acidothermaceae bacterium]
MTANGRLALVGFGWLLVIVTAIGLISRQFDAGLQLFVVLAVLIPYGIALAALALAAHAVARSRWGVAAAAVLLVLTLAMQLPLYLAHGSRPKDAIGFTVLSANLRYGSADAAHLVDVARSEHADALALQELTPQEVQRLRAAGIDRDFPFAQVAAGPGATGVGLWSRRPMSDKQSYGGFTFHQVSAKIAFDPSEPRKTFTLFSTHVVAPWPGPTTLWVHELTKLAVLIGSQSGTTVDAGDFNSTLDVPQFRQLLDRTGYADAARQSGSGLIRTFPTDTAFPPLAGIDHVLAKGATATSVQTVAVPGSDHRGIVVRLLLPTR